jgi:hypothetical protein
VAKNLEKLIIWVFLSGRISEDETELKEFTSSFKNTPVSKLATEIT